MIFWFTDQFSDQRSSANSAMLCHQHTIPPHNYELTLFRIAPFNVKHLESLKSSSCSENLDNINKHFLVHGWKVTVTDVYKYSSVTG